MIVSFGKKKKTVNKMKKTGKKLYTIKRSKTGRKSVVQVIVKAKGRVYASTGKKVPSSKKCYHKKSDATKALRRVSKTKKKMSFGKKHTRRLKNEGYIACGNPDSDKPSNTYKVYKAYKHKYDGTTYILFKTGSGDDTKYYTLNEDSYTKFRRDKAKATADKIKYTRLYSAEVPDFMQATPCNDVFFKQIQSGGGMGGVGGVAYDRIRSNTFLDMDAAQLTGSLTGDRKKLSLVRKGFLERDGSIVAGQAQTPLNKRDSAFLEALGAKGSKGNLMIPSYIAGRGGSNLKAVMKGIPSNATGIIHNQGRHSLRGVANKEEMKRTIGKTQLFPNSFGRRCLNRASCGSDFGANGFGANGFGGMNRFGRNFPTYSKKFAYPVDPAFLRSQFGNGNRYGGARFGNNVARVNYGFSRYF